MRQREHKGNNFNTEWVTLLKINSKLEALLQSEGLRKKKQTKKKNSSNIGFWHSSYLAKKVSDKLISCATLMLAYSSRYSKLGI